MAKKQKKKHEEPVVEETVNIQAEPQQDEQIKDEHHEEDREPEETAKPTQPSGDKQKPWTKLYNWALTHKKISIPAAIVILLATILAIPFTRYEIVGLIVKQNFSVTIVDSQTNKPVSSASITLNNITVETDGEGRATIRTKVGSADLSITKNYYEARTQKVLVPLHRQKRSLEIQLNAQGRPVPVTILNAINKQPVANAIIVAQNSEAKTDAEGKALLVVPSDMNEAEVQINSDGFNSKTLPLTITTDEVDANTFSLTPSGKVYFLSNASGKLDVVKTNLDGSDRQTVLAGTGKEDQSNTILSASSDWKYLALLSRREGGEHAKLFLIETSSGSVVTMDEGAAYFETYGWSGDRFIYTVDRNRKDWESGKQALKSYSASDKKITTLSETDGVGEAGNYAYESFNNNIYLVGEEIVFIKIWQGYCDWNAYHVHCYASAWIPRKDSTLNTIRPDGSQKKVINNYAHPFIESKNADFGKIHIRALQGQKYEIDEYFDGKLQTINKDDKGEFYENSYPSYSVSPTGQTLWSKNVDGKNTLFVGDSHGENGKEIGRSDSFNTSGWFNDSYVLLAKGSELYIMPAEGLAGGVETALKISDFYRTSNRYYH